MAMIRATVLTRTRRKRKSKQNAEGSKHSVRPRRKQLQKGVGIRFARETAESVHAIESFNLSEHPIIHKHNPIFFCSFQELSFSIS